MNEVEQQVYEHCRLAHHINLSQLQNKYKLNVIDKCLRGASDVATANNLTVSNWTGSILQWCQRWSERALDQYWEAQRVLTSEREGKPPTHRQVTFYRLPNGKRPWIVEHQYPFKIIKEHVQAGATVDFIYDWIWEYGRATILLKEEDPDLLYCKTEEEAHGRYDHVKIVHHPHFIEQKDTE